MPFDFDIKINEQDLYRFNIHHAYTSSQGVISIVAAAVLFVVSAVTYGTIDWIDSVLYVCLGVVFLVFMPIQLKLRSKQQIMLSPVLQGTLHYSFTEKGVLVSSQEVKDEAEEDALLPWDMIYKVETTKTQLLIYSNRVNAYIIPLKNVEEIYPQIKEILQKKVEAYKLKLK